MSVKGEILSVGATEFLWPGVVDPVEGLASFLATLRKRTADLARDVEVAEFLLGRLRAERFKREGSA